MSRTAAFAAICAEGRDLRDGVAPYFSFTYWITRSRPLLAEVDVEVGHRHTFRVPETFEQQVVAQRIEVGRRQAHRRRASPRPNPGPAPPARHSFFAQLMKSATIRK